MNEAMQFVVILGSLTVLIAGAIGVPLVLGLLGAARLKAFEQRLREIERQNDARLAEVEERVDFAERMLMQVRERGGLRPGEPPG